MKSFSKLVRAVALSCLTLVACADDELGKSPHVVDVRGIGSGVQPECGDGVMASSEECDDGNRDPGDGCDHRCRLEACGNGVRDRTEQCDDGNRDPGDGCDHRCRHEVCGNGRRDRGEECDDGNTDVGDGCSAECLHETPMCGDGKLDDEEGCDDGNRDPGDGCDHRCRLEQCGNGRRDRGEECEDGNRDRGDGCDHRCRYEICGNGRRDLGEQCDDGNTDSGDDCPADCQWAADEPPPPACGDGNLDPGEGCDDGNLRSGDGCTDQCVIEICGDEVVDEGEQCDPPQDGVCTEGCQLVPLSCGDGVLDLDKGEECDDQNDTRGDGCSDCHFECGNRILERDLGEECEPAFTKEGTCDDQCQRPVLCGDGVIEGDEECDPGDGETCVDCRIVVPPGAVCGDGNVEGLEQCDPPDGVSCVACRTVPPHCEPKNDTVVMVKNGTFDDGVDGWIMRAKVTATHAFAEGVTGRGSLRLKFEGERNKTGRHLSGAYQCVPVSPSTEYELRAALLVPVSVSLETVLGLEVRFHASDDCTGDFVRPSGVGRASYDTGAWAGQRWSFPTASDTASLAIHLTINKPRAVAATVYWDDIALTPMVASSCGDCVIDDGENCDDGNRQAGDGCNAFCIREECGNGIVEGQEECDDGDVLFGDSSDTCTPTCRLKSTCDLCVQDNCAADAAACLDLSGVAASGPGEGTARSVLCAELRDCVHRTGCDGETASSQKPEGFGGGPFLENCYCGASEQQCFMGAATGTCRAEVEAALETADPTKILSRMTGTDTSYPVFAALRKLTACEMPANGTGGSCEADPSTRCRAEPVCGDGVVQDRTPAASADLKLEGDRQTLTCRDPLTASGAGCSIEECDDGNVLDGDGCDAKCFVEACGNYLKQGAEECDDGNLIDGDGCDRQCVREYTCGNAIVEAPFEECDPPGSGTLCSIEQLEDNPTQCGCDAECTRLVCGNGIVQAPEEACDPPGPLCDDQCQPLTDLCIEGLAKVREVAGSTECLAPYALYGTPGTQFEVGCVDNKPCFDLLQCMRTTQCAYAFTTPAGCYCGEFEGGECETAGWEPTGPCRQEILVAYEDQLGLPPESNADVVANLTNPGQSPAGIPALGVGFLLGTYCLIPDDAPTTSTSLRELLRLSGVTDEDQLNEYVSACFE